MVSDLIIRELADNLYSAGLVDEDGSSLANNTAFRNAVTDAWARAVEIVSKPRTPMPKLPSQEYLLDPVEEDSACLAIKVCVGTGFINLWKPVPDSHIRITIRGGGPVELTKDLASRIIAALKGAGELR